MREIRRSRTLCFALLIVGVLTQLPLIAQTKLPSSPIKTVYIVPTSHYDLGFVEPPSAVRERAARHIDEVIRMASTDPDFRWTIESVWQVEEWLKRAQKPSSVLPKDKEKIIKLAALLKSGRVELSADGDVWQARTGDLLVVPPARHSLRALEDSTVLLTAVPRGHGN